MKFVLASLGIVSVLMAQGGRPQTPEGLRQAVQLNLSGDYGAARSLIQKEIDGAATPLLKANAQRIMAMSYDFERNCAKTIEYEAQEMSYWVTREKEEPKNAFYQKGEMANEAARVCIDSGDLNAAGKWYAKGAELGFKEPEISSERKALWEFRLEKANQNDACIMCLKAEALEKLGRKDEAMELYKKAAANRSYNPPAAFAGPLAQKRLG